MFALSFVPTFRTPSHLVQELTMCHALSYERDTEIHKSQTLEHLGLVAAMFDELGIGDLVDELLPQDLSQREVSVGQALKAMVLNGLGFANRRLYLMPEFFRNKPTERLVGAGVSPERLNDDALGKALDTLARLRAHRTLPLDCRAGRRAARPRERGGDGTLGYHQLPCGWALQQRTR
jgi:Domain of unknown function (DUF4277)